MPLTTQLDLTQVITTTLSIPEASGVVQTSVGTVSTQLGTTTTSTIATVLQTGLQGEKGDTGSRGLDGKSAYEVWLDNGGIGTEQDFLDSLVSTIPGPTGPTGLTGLQGTQGVAGQDGANGLSAYQVAVSNGFVGTEAAWLTSLVGPKGDAGAQGVQGVQGSKGDKGDTGSQGVQGIQGEQGLQGIQGIAGPKGDTGAQGPIGLTGAAGYTPVKGVDYFDGTDGTDGQDGQDGVTPVVTLVGDQIVINGVTQPTHLTGPAGSDSPLGEAPTDGKQYARKDGAWAEVTGGGGTQQVFVQTTAPVVSTGTQYIWFQTGIGEGNDMTLWVEDGL